MKEFTRILALTLALLLSVSLLAACGSSDSNQSGTGAEDKSTESAGERTTWGEISVVVPAGMHLTGGNGTLDPDDPKTAWLYEDDNAMHYIKISVVDSSDAAKKSVTDTISFNKEYSPGKIVYEGTKTSWSGTTYLYNDSPCNTFYGEVNDKVFLIMTYGFELSGASALAAVLDSLE